jgi:hypothetical protein
MTAHEGKVVSLTARFVVGMKRGDHLCHRQSMLARAKRSNKVLTVESELSGEDACERPAVVSLVGHQLDLTVAVDLNSGIH